EDLARGQRLRDRHELVFPDDVRDDENEGQDRDVAERVNGEAVLRQVVDAAEIGDAEADDEQPHARPLDAARFWEEEEELEQRGDQVTEKEGEERNAGDDRVARIEAPPILRDAGDERV